MQSSVLQTTNMVVHASFFLVTPKSCPPTYSSSNSFSPPKLEPLTLTHPPPKLNL